MINFIEKFDPERIGIAAHALKRPDKPALIMDDHIVTYGALHKDTNALANALLELGIGPGDRISVLMHNSPEIMKVWTAAGKISVTPIPLSYRFKSDELAYIVNDSESKALIYGHELEEIIREAGPKFSSDSLIHICVGGVPSSGRLNLEYLIQRGSDGPPKVEMVARGVASSLAYTSGTTGRSKGVVKSSKKRLDNLLGTAYTFGLTYEDTHLVVGPLYHGAPFGLAACSLILGNKVVIMPRFDAENFLRLVQDHGVTTTFVVPTMLNRILNLPDSVKASYDISSLRVVIVGAEFFPFPLKKRVIEQFGEGKVFEFYGSTEISVVTYLRPEEQLAKPGSCGRPAMGSDIRLLDENKNEVPPGEVGILYAKSPFLLDAYYRNPEATKACYHQGYFTVGDMARVDEKGYYYIVDRAVDMIISGGVNIYPAEIEEVIYRHPVVYGAAVIGVPDPDWGEKIVAYVIPRSGHSLTGEEIITFVADNLASYKKPREVYFVKELPYSPSGKLLKRVLRDEYMKQGHKITS